MLHKHRRGDRGKHLSDLIDDPYERRDSEDYLDDVNEIQQFLDDVCGQSLADLSEQSCFDLSACDEGFVGQDFDQECSGPKVPGVAKFVPEKPYLTNNSDNPDITVTLNAYSSRLDEKIGDCIYQELFNQEKVYEEEDQVNKVLSAILAYDPEDLVQVRFSR